LELTKGRNIASMKEKVDFYKSELEPVVEELSKRNPNPDPASQVPLVLGGVWTPIWSTIPFQDSLPGRSLEQSYQIFRDTGFYANIARYAPGSQLKIGWGLKLASFLLALDLMIVQKYGIVNDKWYIENVAIKQALRWSGKPLSISDANNWVDKVIPSLPKDAQSGSSIIPDLENVDARTKKRLDTVFQTKPTLEHMYIDDELRIVKTRREANQRPSYTVAIRRGGLYEDRARIQGNALLPHPSQRNVQARKSGNALLGKLHAGNDILRKSTPCGLRRQRARLM